MFVIVNNTIVLKPKILKAFILSEEHKLEHKNYVKQFYDTDATLCITVC